MKLLVSLFKIHDCSQTDRLPGNTGERRLDRAVAGSTRAASGRGRRAVTTFRSETTKAHALYPSHRSLSTKVNVSIDALVA